MLKEDIYKFVERRDNAAPADQRRPAAATAAADSAVQTETRLQLTGTQLHMFKAMTRSLAIPHFLYADEVDFTSLSDLRTRLNGVLAKSAAAAAGTAPQHSVSRLSYLPFNIKAVSMALYQYPTLNAWVDVPDDGPAARPALVLRSQHNVGVAMDTPAGLVVPVVKNVNSRNILSIAAELVRLQALALTGKLAPADLTGGTITVSNIGNIGGTYLSPVVVEREVAILGVGPRAHGTGLRRGRPRRQAPDVPLQLERRPPRRRRRHAGARRRGCAPGRRGARRDDHAAAVRGEPVPRRQASTEHEQLKRRSARTEHERLKRRGRAAATWTRRIWREQNVARDYAPPREQRTW